MSSPVLSSAACFPGWATECPTALVFREGHTWPTVCTTIRVACLWPRPRCWLCHPPAKQRWLLLLFPIIMSHFQEGLKVAPVLSWHVGSVWAWACLVKLLWDYIFFLDPVESRSSSPYMSLTHTNVKENRKTFWESVATVTWCYDLFIISRKTQHTLWLSWSVLTVLGLLLWNAEQLFPGS